MSQALSKPSIRQGTNSYGWIIRASHQQREKIWSMLWKIDKLGVYSQEGWGDNEILVVPNAGFTLLTTLPYVIAAIYVATSKLTFLELWKMNTAEHIQVIKSSIDLPETVVMPKSHLDTLEAFVEFANQEWPKTPEAMAALLAYLKAEKPITDAFSRIRTYLTYESAAWPTSRPSANTTPVFAAKEVHLDHWIQNAIDAFTIALARNTAVDMRINLSNRYGSRARLIGSIEHRASEACRRLRFLPVNGTYADPDAWKLDLEACEAQVAELEGLHREALRLDQELSTYLERAVSLINSFIDGLEGGSVSILASHWDRLTATIEHLQTQMASIRAEYPEGEADLIEQAVRRMTPPEPPSKK